MRKSWLVLFTFIGSSFFSSPSQAEEKTYQRLEALSIVGDRYSSNETHQISGSVNIIEKKDIKKSSAQNLADLLDHEPGLSVRNEDGLGLRPNISIRGISGDRSRKVLILEDGVPISLAPYGENSSYYFPEMDRIERVEIRKGSSSILYGPQTIGGVINLISDSPEKNLMKYNFKLGDNRFRSHKLLFKNKWKKLSGVHSIIDKSGYGTRSPSEFSIFDLNSKFYFDITPLSTLSIKGHYYLENADVSYTGLTEAEYNDNPFMNTAPYDHFHLG